MNTSNIASDAMRVSLAMELEGEEQFLADLQTVNTKAKRMTEESLLIKRMEVEGKYDPAIQRDVEIEKAIKLTDQLNISLKTQDAILEEIQAKYERATAIQPQYTGELPGERMAADFRRRQKELDDEFLADKQRLARQIERIEEESLSHRERLLKRFAELRDQKSKGLIDDRQFNIAAKAAKQEYDDAIENENRITKAKKDAEDKRLEIEANAAAKRQAAANRETQRLNLEIGKRAQAAIDEGIEATQARAKAAIEATAAADREANAARQEAVNLMRSYQSTTERATQDIEFFNQALADGVISAREHEAAIAGVEARQQSMMGGTGRLGFVIGSAVTGFEDFVTVMSITGYGLDSFAAATRSASNNLGQAVRGMGTASSAIMAPLISIGAVLLGSAIPAVYNWITAADDATDATKRWNNELERLIRLATLGDMDNIRELGRQQALGDIKRMNDPDAIEQEMKQIVDNIAKMQLEMIKASNESEAIALKLFDTMVPMEAMEDFNSVVDGISEGIGGEAGAGVEDAIREMMARAKAAFVENAKDLGAEEAKRILELDMREIQEAIQMHYDMLDGISRSKIKFDQDSTFNEFINAFGALNDAAIIDRIQALQEELDQLTLADVEANKEKIKQIEDEMAKLNEMHDRRLEAIEEVRKAEGEAREESMHLARQQMDDELEALKIQSKRNTLLGEENQAERELFDLALRRREIMESGLAGPAVLEEMFNAELEAIAAEYEDKIAKSQQVGGKADMQNQASAMTEANRMVQEAIGKENTAEKEALEVLKAIRDHLAGRAMIGIEVI